MTRLLYIRHKCCVLYFRVNEVTEIGRPAVDVDLSEVLHLRSLHFTWTKISELVGISRSTLYRRLWDAGICTDDYTSISSSELDDTIRSVKSQFPNDGEVMMNGHLLRLGIKVTRQDLRDSIHRVDHANTVNRRSNVVQRRVYTVSCPNALWHIDSHHKLIRWRLITHAAVDGFSRKITYIMCADNNKVSTVLQCFMYGVSKFGLPQRIRSDHSGENIDIWRYMVIANNGDTSCVVTGSSTHNERIERMWRDVHRSVTTTYADTFRSLESDGVLDPMWICTVCTMSICHEYGSHSWTFNMLGTITPFQLKVVKLLTNYSTRGQC